MQQQNVKSATTAGLLGIFLGSFGAHNWYLGEKNKGIAHVCMMAGGILVEVVATAVLPNVVNPITFLQMAWLFTALAGVAGIAMSASAIWGLVEGITILSQGDAGLAAKGYMVAAQQPIANQNYGYRPQNYGPQQGYNYGPQQNYNPNQNYNNFPQAPNQPPMNVNFNNQPQEAPNQPSMNDNPSNQPQAADTQNMNSGDSSGENNEQQ